MTIIGAHIDGTDLCYTCAKEELETVLTAIEAEEALSSWNSNKYSSWPLRYDGKITDLVVYYDEEECEYVVSPYRNFRLSHAHLTFYDLDVKEASERTFSESGLERLLLHELIYVAKVDGKLIITADEDFIGDNDEKATYVVRRDYYVENSDKAIIRAIVEANYRNGIYRYSDHDSNDNNDGMPCENWSNCKNAKGGIYYIYDPYETLCGCSGCDSCIKSEGAKNCILTVATGDAAVVAEEGYEWRQRLCPDCQAQALLAIDEAVKTFVDDLTPYYAWNGDTDSVRELDRISTILTQYGAYHGYEHIADRLTVHDECNNTARAKVVTFIEQLCEANNIALDELLYCEWVEKLENDYNLVERVKRDIYNEKAEKYNKRFCNCPVHANSR